MKEIKIPIEKWSFLCAPLTAEAENVLLKILCRMKEEDYISECCIFTESLPILFKCSQEKVANILSQLSNNGLLLIEERDAFTCFKDNKIFLNKAKRIKKSVTFDARDFKKFLIDEGCNPQHVDDWLAVRNKKKVVNTKTALTRIVNECKKHGVSLKNAIEMCASNGWAGFKYEWVQNQSNEQTINRQTSNTIRKNSEGW